jgi:metal-sulfur cluster biosynthetic enzyme
MTDTPARIPARIMDALRTVYDPCCRDKGVSVVDMGLVDHVAVDGDRASVQLVLTTGWCPFAVDLLGAITERIRSLPEVAAASVEVTWDKAWSTDRLSDDARAKLRFLPDPSSVPDRDAYLEQARREGVRQ